MSSFVVVWRSAEGAAVQTYAHDDKTPRTFTDGDAPETHDVPAVKRDAFVKLLENREAFEPVRVESSAVQDLLGWAV